MMVEAGANEVPEERDSRRHPLCPRGDQAHVALQDEMREAVGKPKVEVPLYEPDPEVAEWARRWVEPKLTEAVTNPDKQEREECHASACGSRSWTALTWRSTARSGRAGQGRGRASSTSSSRKKCGKMITEDRRAGRTAAPCDEIRPIWCEVGLLPRVHGSGLFTRGQTQVLTIVYPGAQVATSRSLTTSARKIASATSTTTTSPASRWVRRGRCGRRAGGRSATGPWRSGRCCRSSRPRRSSRTPSALVSEVLSSNGSTSHGQRLRQHPGADGRGRAHQARRWRASPWAWSSTATGLPILSDIQGIEDALGDMDFKVAGTETGVTALQMDIKIGGVTREILAEGPANRRARAGMYILGKMLEVIDRPRPGASRRSRPRIITLTIPSTRSATSSGPGGKMIRKIIDETGVQIDIEDDGTRLHRLHQRGGGERRQGDDREPDPGRGGRARIYQAR